MDELHCATDITGTTDLGMKRKRDPGCNQDLPTSQTEFENRTRPKRTKRGLSADGCSPPTGIDVDLQSNPDLLPKNHFSALAGAHHFVSNGATYNNILGNYIVTAKASGDGQWRTDEILFKLKP
ncbi:hypothetical protein GALMADRAFT_241856 [Galerina marginata CBS 339.88]|uniref:Uncharacterized protein n=1 Tax=Galerina marginata (strain CBS 339.88) TaxID=685588 RepID=A0A067TIN1_GALM3|nr:hypothetical protein GALMADRAFT_241856 [Galerina marginata CBS 339.88]